MEKEIKYPAFDSYELERTEWEVWKEIKYGDPFDTPIPPALEEFINRDGTDQKASRANQLLPFAISARNVPVIFFLREQGAVTDDPELIEECAQAEKTWDVFKAVKEGDIQTTQHYLDNGGSIDTDLFCKGCYAFNLFKWAIQHRQEEIIDLFIEQQIIKWPSVAFTSLADISHFPPSSDEERLKDVRIAEKLLVVGAWISNQYYHCAGFWSLAFTAQKNENVEFMRFLLQKGIHKHRIPINDIKNQLTWLLNIVCHTYLENPNSSDESKRRNRQFISLLIEYGADPARGAPNVMIDGRWKTILARAYNAVHRIHHNTKGAIDLANEKKDHELAELMAEKRKKYLADSLPIPASTPVPRSAFTNSATLPRPAKAAEIESSTPQIEEHLSEQSVRSRHLFSGLNWWVPDNSQNHIAAPKEAEQPKTLHLRR